MTALLLANVSLCLGQDWPRFRGSDGAGIGMATNLPVQWKSTDFVFRAELPGDGHSSPIIVADRVFLTAADAATRQFIVVSLHAKTGASLWQRSFPVPHYTTHRNNNFASSTPAASSNRVFVLRVQDQELLLTAFTHSGEPSWEYRGGPFESEHGLGHSPVVVDNRVIFANDQDLAGKIIALDAANGRLIWETPRSSGRADYSTPCVFNTPAGGPQLLLNTCEDGMGAVSVIDGRILWHSPGILKMRSVSSPVVAGDLVIGTCGSGGGGNYLVALRPPSQTGEPAQTAYEIRRAAPYVPTPIVQGPLLFLWNDAGIVSAAEAATGKILWQERVGGDYYASPVLADGKLINLSTRGEVVMLAASTQYQMLGRNPLGQPGNASPAVAAGRLYIRTLRQLIVVGGKSSP